MSVTNQTREQSLLVVCPPSSSLKVGLQQTVLLMTSVAILELANQEQSVAKIEKLAILVQREKLPSKGRSTVKIANQASSRRQLVRQHASCVIKPKENTRTNQHLSSARFAKQVKFPREQKLVSHHCMIQIFQCQRTWSFNALMLQVGAS